MQHDVTNQRVRVVSGPANEPITLAELKAQLGITDTAQDTFITSLIEPARLIVEEYLGRKLISQGLELFMDVWPGATQDIWEGSRLGSSSSLVGLREFDLPWLPAQSVDVISTFNEDDTETVFPATSYIVDVWDPDLWGRVVLRDSSVWPPNLREARAIRVQYTVGYGDDAEDVPSSIRQGLLMVAAYMYTNRGDCPSDTTKCVAAAGASASLAFYRVMRV